MSEILDGFLFLGSGRDAGDLESTKIPFSLINTVLALGEHKIKHVLNATQEWRQTRGGEIVHHRIPLADFTNEV